jgi:hypothetical protein
MTFTLSKSKPFCKIGSFRYSKSDNFTTLVLQKSLLYDYSYAFNVMLVCWVVDAFIVGKISVKYIKPTYLHP